MRIRDWRLHGGPDVLVHLIARAGALDVEMVRAVMEARRLLLAPLAAGTMAVFWGVSIPLYLNAGWTRPIWRACRARSGRDWMLNSGVFNLDHRHPSRRTHAISAAIFATYPLWLWLGYRDGKR